MISKAITIAGKELTTYFKSPLAYLILMITTVVFNTFFYMIVDDNREATLRDIFRLMEFMFVFFIPLLTMKTFAEEKSTGTLEFLFTSPVKVSSMVLGKFLGSLWLYTLMILSSGVFYFVIEYFATLDRWATLTGYLGIWLEGAFFIAIGTMCSSFTKNQIIASLTSYVLLFFLYFSISFIKYFDGVAEEIIRIICTTSHSANFFDGIIQTIDVVYYISGIIIALAITRVVLNKRY